MTLFLPWFYGAAKPQRLEMVQPVRNLLPEQQNSTCFSQYRTVHGCGRNLHLMHLFQLGKPVGNIHLLSLLLLLYAAHYTLYDTLHTANHTTHCTIHCTQHFTLHTILHTKCCYTHFIPYYILPYTLHYTLHTALHYSLHATLHSAHYATHKTQNTALTPFLACYTHIVHTTNSSQHTTFRPPNN